MVTFSPTQLLSGINIESIVNVSQFSQNDYYSVYSSNVYKWKMRSLLRDSRVEIMNGKKSKVLFLIPLASLLYLSPPSSAETSRSTRVDDKDRSISSIDSHDCSEELYGSLQDFVYELPIDNPDHPDYEPPRSWWSEFSTFLKEADIESMVEDLASYSDLHDPDPDWL